MDLYAQNRILLDNETDSERVSMLTLNVRHDHMLGTIRETKNELRDPLVSVVPLQSLSLQLPKLLLCTVPPIQDSSLAHAIHVRFGAPIYPLRDRLSLGHPSSRVEAVADDGY